MEKIVVKVDLGEKEKSRLIAAAGENKIIFDYSKDEAADATAVIGNVPLADIQNNVNLKWLQLQTAGTEPYSVAGNLREDTKITNTSGAFGLAISEHMVGCVFELYKKFHLYRDNQNQSVWKDMGSVKRVEGSRVLILGFGDIGQMFGKKMKALGCEIIGVCRTKKEKPDFCDELYTSESIDNEIPKADIIAMALPNTPDTVGIISKDRIALMKEDAILVNVGRGNAVDTDALTEALQNGKIGGCSLDVTNPEPLPSDHPLWKCRNAVITPHVSGFFHLEDTYNMIIDIMVENLSRFTSGRPLLNIVDRKTGYRTVDCEKFAKK